MAEKLDRRAFIGLAGGVALLALLPHMLSAADDDHDRKGFAVTMSDEEWKDKLTPEQYRVLREEGTERAFTSPLNNEKREGVFKCAGCGAVLFSSDTKYESGSGWPSFFAPIDAKAVGTSTDHKLVYSRTEVHCANCGGHLGHVFDDGPQPTGKRFCMNGVALEFQPGKKTP